MSGLPIEQAKVPSVPINLVRSRAAHEDRQALRPRLENSPTQQTDPFLIPRREVELASPAVSETAVPSMVASKGVLPAVPS
jgi:hypothetical protein